MTKTARPLPLALLVIVLATAIVSCNNRASESAKDADTAPDTVTDTTAAVIAAEAQLSGVYADTSVTGTARFTRTDNGGVKLNLAIIVPAKASQSVAVHIHETGSCADSAKAAGAHWNPTGAQHGKWGTSSFHSGDIGNVMLDGAGNRPLVDWWRCPKRYSG
jgi:superoxide dismutase, Cu-Zn family